MHAQRAMLPPAERLSELAISAPSAENAMQVTSAAWGDSSSTPPSMATESAVAG